MIPTTPEQLRNWTPPSNRGRCDVCQERLFATDEQAEMFLPGFPMMPTFLVHAECGLARGMEVA